MWNDCWYHQLINNKTFWYLHRSCRVFGTGAAVGALRNFCWATSFADVLTRKINCAGRNHGSKFPLLFFQNTHCQMQFPAQPKFSRRYLQRSVAYRLVFSRYRGGISGLRLAHSLFGEQELVEKAMRIGETKKKEKKERAEEKKKKKTKERGFSSWKLLGLDGGRKNVTSWLFLYRNSRNPQRNDPKRESGEDRNWKEKKGRKKETKKERKKLSVYWLLGSSSGGHRIYRVGP